MSAPLPFSQPVYVTRPLLPSLERYTRLLIGIWERQWLTNDGQLVRQLAQELAALLAVPSISMFANGTIALQLALAALELQGEVITTPFTFPATPHVLTWGGLTPVFADIDPDTLTLSPDAVKQAISPNTSAILGVHVYGMPCDVYGLGAIAKAAGLRTLYDGAHAFGTRINGVPIGLFGDITMLSFHATKLFNTAEGGGLIATDPDLVNRVELLRNFGIRDETTVLHPGINAKMTELQAALGLALLEDLTIEHSLRSNIFELYKTRLADVEGIRLFELPSNVVNSLQYAVVLVDQEKAGLSRDDLYEGMKTFNIFARRYFYPLCSEVPFYHNLPSSHRSNLPIAYRVSRQVLALPYYGSLGLDGASRVIDVILYLLGRQHASS